MYKNFFKVMPAMAFFAFALSFCSCSDSDSDSDDTPEKPDTEQPGGNPDPEPVNHNKIFAGDWSQRGGDTPMGEWVIDENGNIQVLRIRHDVILGSIDISRDSCYVECVRNLTLDYNPDFQTLTFTENGETTQASVVSIEENRIEYKEDESDNTLVLRKNGEYCSEAPESIEGLYMGANRYKVHGLRFYPKGKCTQYFYYDDVVDNLISEYTYTKLEGNKAKIVYHVQYRLNPDKQKYYTGLTNAKFADATFDLNGELDLTFFTHVEASKPSDERYLGEFEGNVHVTLTNHKTGAVTEQDVTGRKYFVMSTAEDW